MKTPLFLLDYRNKDLLSPYYVSGAVSLFVGVLPGSCVMGYTVTDAVQDNNGQDFSRSVQKTEWSQALNWTFRLPWFLKRGKKTFGE